MKYLCAVLVLAIVLFLCCGCPDEGSTGGGEGGCTYVQKCITYSICQGADGLSLHVGLCPEGTTYMGQGDTTCRDVCE